jgi:hypothetical protein
MRPIAGFSDVTPELKRPARSAKRDVLGPRVRRLSAGRRGAPRDWRTFASLAAKGKTSEIPG